MKVDSLKRFMNQYIKNEPYVRHEALQLTAKSAEC